MRQSGYTANAHAKHHDFKTRMDDKQGSSTSALRHPTFVWKKRQHFQTLNPKNPTSFQPYIQTHSVHVLTRRARTGCLTCGARTYAQRPMEISMSGGRRPTGRLRPPRRDRWSPATEARHAPPASPARISPLCTRA